MKRAAISLCLNGVLLMAFMGVCSAETLVHLSFDDSIDANGVSVKNGTPVYAEDVPGPQVCWTTAGTTERNKRANSKSVHVDKTILDLSLSNERLFAPNLPNATIEFFIKGVVAAAWECPLSISKGGSPYPFLLQSNNSLRFIYRADTSIAQGSIASDCRSADNVWHHIAMTVAPVEGGFSEIRFYADYVLVGSVTTSVDSWQGLADGMFIRLGAANSSCYFDEFRVSDKALSPDEFLRLEPVVRDGDTLLHLTFENEDFSSVIRPAESPALYSGTPSFTNDVPHAVIWKGDEEVSRSNMRALHAKNSAITLTIPTVQLLSPQPLAKPNLTATTIEFFYKGISAQALNSWPVVFYLGGVSGLYIIQVDGAGNCYHRVDTSSLSTDRYFYTGRRFADGYWHHVALTIADVDGGGSALKFYVDHVLTHSCTTATAWNGLGALNLTIGNANIDVLVDEIRVSKGTLPVAGLLPGAPVTVDKETLVYLPFDGHISSLGRADTQPVLCGGNPLFAATRFAPLIDVGEGVRRENSGALHLQTGVDSVCLSFPSNALLRPYLDSATIEFFIKGESCSAWDNVFSLVPDMNRPGTPPFPLSLQINAARGLRIRTDGFANVHDGSNESSRESLILSDSLTADFADGKWHHYAITIEPTGAGQTHYRVFKDYVPLDEEGNTSDVYPFMGLTEGMVLRVGGASFYMDEFRITKGVLSSEEFLRRAKIGFSINFR